MYVVLIFGFRLDVYFNFLSNVCMLFSRWASVKMFILTLNVRKYVFFSVGLSSRR